MSVAHLMLLALWVAAGTAVVFLMDIPLAAKLMASLGFAGASVFLFGFALAANEYAESMDARKRREAQR